MPTKLNSFTLSDDIIKKMEDQIDLTHKTGLEHGFNICKIKDKLIIKDDCVGTKCSLSLSHNCYHNLRKIPKVGDYHTHPGGEPRFDYRDALTACLYDFSCIGSDKNNEINCYVKNSNPNCIRDIEKLGTEGTALHDLYKKLDELGSKPDTNHELFNTEAYKYNIRLRSFRVKLDKEVTKYFDKVKIK